MESAFQALGLATKAEPAGVWAIIAKAMMRQDSTGHKLLLKLSHWYGESIPPEVLLGWAKENGPKGFSFAANLLTVKSGQPSEAARLLVREAPNQKEVLARIFASLSPGGAFRVQSQGLWSVNWSHCESLPPTRNLAYGNGRRLNFTIPKRA